MSWWATGITAAMGVKKGMDNEARMSKNDKFRKAALTYAPWTGMGDPGSQQLPGAMESGLTGAATGAMMGSMAGGASPAAAGSETAVAGGLGSGAEAAKLEGLKFTPEQMQQPLMQAGATAGTGAPLQGSEMQGMGKYSLMGDQAGSAGALGANPLGQQNPLAKYMLMSQQK